MAWCVGKYSPAAAGRDPEAVRGNGADLRRPDGAKVVDLHLVPELALRRLQEEAGIGIA